MHAWVQTALDVDPASRCGFVTESLPARVISPELDVNDLHNNDIVVLWVPQIKDGTVAMLVVGYIPEAEPMRVPSPHPPPFPIIRLGRTGNPRKILGLSSSVRRSRFASDRGRFAGQVRNCHCSLVRSQPARKA